MNVLVLAESLDPSSGWGAYTRSLVAALHKSDVRLTVLTSDPLSEGPRLPRVNSGRIGWMLGRIRLQSWMRGQSFDVVHVMVEPYATLHRAFGNVPFILTGHGTYVDPAAHGRSASVFRNALGQACKIVAVSEYTREQVPTEFQKSTVVIPNGVDLGIVDESFDESPTHGSPLVLSVGAMKSRKGFDRLITGFAEFVRSHADAELVIIGRDDDPSLRQRLTAQAERLGIASRVRLIGEVSRSALLGWYRACDVFALTPVSDGGFEGFGLVYLEANVFGKPAVGAVESGATSAIQEGESGYLVSSEDPQGIARALTDAMKLSVEGVKHWASLSSWNERSMEYVREYRLCQKKT